MSNEPLPDSPSSASPRPSPTPVDLLKACAEVSPALWFPSVHAEKTGLARESLDVPLLQLRETVLIQVEDWVKGKGQGYRLTESGREVLANEGMLLALKHGTLPVKQTLPVSEVPSPQVSNPKPDVNPQAKSEPLTRYDRGELAREAFLDPKPGIITPILVVLIVGWFLVGLYLARESTFTAKEYLRGNDSGTVLQLGAVFGPRLLAGEWWRLVASVFVHFGLLHLAGNVLALVMIGPFAENLLSRRRFLVMYLLSGIVGAAAATANNPGAAIAGSSGANWGMMLAVLGWILRYREHLPPHDVSFVMRRLGFVVLVNAMVSLAPGVSWEGHLAGGLTGFVTAGLLDWIHPNQGRRRVLRGLIGLILFLLVCTGSFLAIIRYSPEWKATRAFTQIFHIPSHAAVPMQLRTLPQQVSDSRVHAIYTSAVLALAARPPHLLKELEAATNHLDRAAQVFRPIADPKFHPYLAQIHEFVELVRSLIAAKVVPSKAQWDALEAKRDHLTKEWNRLTSHQSPMN